MKGPDHAATPNSPAPALPPAAPSRGAEAAKALEAMLQEKSVPAEESRLAGTIRSLSDHLQAIRDSIAPLQKDIAEIRTEMQRIKTDDHVFAEMHDRCRELGEQYYEREVLGPFLMTAIGIADRCRQQTARLHEMLQKHSGARNRAALLAIRQILDARTADRLEIESLLANYGVEPHESPDQAFDASLQKCIRRVECESSNLHGRICQRLLPGYQRHGKVLRQEYVSVYVCTDSKRTPNTGDAS